MRTALLILRRLGGSAPEWVLKRDEAARITAATLGALARRGLVRRFAVPGGRPRVELTEATGERPGHGRTPVQGVLL